MLNLIPSAVNQRNVYEVENNVSEDAVISLPDDWWFVLNSYEVFSPKEPAPIYNLESTYKELKKYQREIPQVKYWNKSQGDYRYSGVNKPMADLIRRRKFYNAVSLSAAIIISSLIVLIFSQFLAKI